MDLSTCQAGAELVSFVSSDISLFAKPRIFICILKLNISPVGSLYGLIFPSSRTSVYPHCFFLLSFIFRLCLLSTFAPILYPSHSHPPHPPFSPLFTLSFPSFVLVYLLALVLCLLSTFALNPLPFKFPSTLCHPCLSFLLSPQCVLVYPLPNVDNVSQKASMDNGGKMLKIFQRARLAYK